MYCIYGAAAIVFPSFCPQKVLSRAPAPPPMLKYNLIMYPHRMATTTTTTNKYLNVVVVVRAPQPSQHQPKDYLC